MGSKATPKQVADAQKNIAKNTGLKEALAPVPKSTAKPLKLAPIDAKYVQDNGTLKGTVDALVKFKAGPNAQAVKVNGQWMVPANDKGKPDYSAVKHSNTWIKHVRMDASGNVTYDSAADSDFIEKGTAKYVPKVTDILSRGQYAGANLMDAKIKSFKDFIKDPSPSKAIKIGSSVMTGGFGTDELKAASKGVTGKSKMSYSEPLKELGVTNPIANTVLGTAGDIILDPANLVGGGLVKEATAGEKGAELAKNLAKAAAQHEAEVVASKAAIKTAKATPAAAIRASTGSYKNAHVAKLIAEHKALTDPAHIKAVMDLAAEAGVKAGDALKPGHLTLNLGKSKIALPGSTAAYKKGAEAADWFRNTGMGGALSKAFKTDVVDTGTKLIKDSGIGYQARRVKAANLNELTDEIHSIKAAFSGLSDQELKIVTSAVERNNVSALKGIASTADPTKSLEDFANLAKKYSDSFFQKEVQAGTKDAAQYSSDYLFTHYNNYARPDKVADFKAARNAAIRDQGRSAATTVDKFGIDAAKAAGLKPTERIDHILMQQAAKTNGALTSAAIKQQVFDRFGVKLDGMAAKKAKEIGLVKVGDAGQYVHKDVYEVINYLDRVSQSPKQAEELVNRLTQIQDLWKFQVTAVRPGHHVNNALGDIFVNFLDGTANPKIYKQAMDGVLGTAGAQQVIDVAGRKVSIADLYKEYSLSGARAGRSAIENPEALLQDTFAGKVLNHPIAEKIRNAGDKRENWTRFAHFIDAAKKEGADGKNFADAVKSATERVIHFNHDYGDLTQMEMKLRKTTMPFYTWFRKNTPLMLQQLVSHPGKMVLPEKVMTGLEKLLNPDQQDFEVIGPSYQKFMARLGKDAENLSSIISTHGLPSQDVMTMLDNPKDSSLNVFNQIGPVAAPMEAMSGRDLTTGVPIKSPQQFVGGVLGGPVKLGLDLTDSSNDAKDKILALTRYLTGAKVYQQGAKAKNHEAKTQNTAMMKKLKGG